MKYQLIKEVGKLDKRGQLDLEVLSIPGFWVLLAGTLLATAIGWIVSTKMDYSFPLWQVIVFMLFEVIIVYFIAQKMFE